jgi:hypothetical protein
LVNQVGVSNILKIEILMEVGEIGFINPNGFAHITPF